jgi:hypothetical protein
LSAVAFVLGIATSAAFACGTEFSDVRTPADGAPVGDEASVDAVVSSDSSIVIGPTDAGSAEDAYDASQTADAFESQGQTFFEQMLYPSLDPTCRSNCHGVDAGAEAFFGDDAHSTYPLFIARGFQKVTSSLAAKGMHEGPALTVDQSSLVAYWQKYEPQ